VKLKENKIPMTEIFLYKQNLSKSPKMNVFFAFPAIERFGMASLGYLSIFEKLDMRDDIAVERIFTDTKTTKMHLEDVDVIGFSNSFEIDFLAMLKILEKYNIPFKSKDRTEKHPLVFGGGPVLSANPLPYSELYDFITVGDAQGSFNQIFDILIKMKGRPKEEILKALDGIDSVWIPAFGKNKNVIPSRDELDKPVFTPILSDNSFFPNTFVIEVERGCPKKCNFCMASWLNLPPRFVPADEIIKAIDFALKYTRKIALLGAYVAGHPEFDKILKHIREQNKTEPIELSVSSLRADMNNPDVIKTLVECGAKTATIAIEAGSDRLRKIINKDLSEEEIFESVKVARENGLSGLKIYVMIGIPGETKQDINELISLMKRLKQENKGFDIVLSLATFVPKAQTPFQYVKRNSSKELEKKVQYLKKELHKIGITLRPSSVEWDAVQSVLSRYGDPLTDYLIDVYKQGGNLGAFKQIWRKYQKAGKLPDFETTADEPRGTPWDFIKTVPEEVLKKAYDKALSLM